MISPQSTRWEPLIYTDKGLKCIVLYLYSNVLFSDLINNRKLMIRFYFSPSRCNDTF